LDESKFKMNGRKIKDGEHTKPSDISYFFTKGWEAYEPMNNAS
jgi:hypothetical protein